MYSNFHTKKGKITFANSHNQLKALINDAYPLILTSKETALPIHSQIGGLN